jgi:hypothetical protein
MHLRSQNCSIFFFYLCFSLLNMQVVYCLWYFNANFNNISVIVVVSFIGGGNRRKPPTCRKSLKTETFFVDIKQTACERVQFNRIKIYLHYKSTIKEQVSTCRYNISTKNHISVLAEYL